MAKRSIWTGSISFGLVNVPVKLFSALQQKEVHFNMLHKKDGGRIKLQRVCQKDGEVIEWGDVAKGYEIRKGRMVQIDPAELETLDPVATKTIEIEDFVDLGQIDPIYFDHTYYVAPDKGAAKPYALLHEAMVRLNKVGIARVVLRTKQYLCAVRPFERGLALSTMQYHDEIVDLDDVGIPRMTRPDKRELDMAEQLVDALSRDFDAKKYKDEYRERVLELIQAKARGEEIEVPEPAEREGEGLSLFEALERSLSTGGKKGKTAAKKKAATAARAKKRTRTAAKRKTGGARKKKAA